MPSSRLCVSGGTVVEGTDELVGTGRDEVVGGELVDVGPVLPGARALESDGCVDEYDE